jgi:hypothetical protein
MPMIFPMILAPFLIFGHLINACNCPQRGAAQKRLTQENLAELPSVICKYYWKLAIGRPGATDSETTQSRCSMIRVLSVFLTVGSLVLTHDFPNLVEIVLLD